MNQATPFSKILIANRGEIALRIIRTAHVMGYHTVAVYSSADRRSRHVRTADQAVCIGDALPAQSYLRIEAVIEAARLSRADAIHPGYGFLAENAELERACREAGIVFIGPSAEAIVAMGNKAGAKQLMTDAGVPCVPGYQGEDQSEQNLLEQAKKIGFPIMIKATVGGGGRGMRWVQQAADFADALRSARSEAQNAFGDMEVLLERAIVAPRHIEIQIMADRYGNAIHLGERDCSIQRRHQKVVEEAPSPAVSPNLRAQMGATAVTAVKTIRYEGAGTLEFLLDRDGNFFFMEMNTRLQVEHSVTEAITGLDLVEWQLRIAAGEPLPLQQEQVRWCGHAIEVRLCAENPAQSFMPQSGRMRLWQMPDSIRVEHALESGAEVLPFYDSMIAKLIGSGSDREAARRKLLGGLEDSVALGVDTNQAFLIECLRHPVFIAGAATTDFITEHGPLLLEENPDSHVRASALAAVILYVTDERGRTDTSVRSIAQQLPVTFNFDIGGEPCAAEVTQCVNSRFQVSFAEKTLELQWVEVEGDLVRFACDGLTECAVLVRDRNLLLLRYRGRAYRVEDRTYAAAIHGRNAAGDGKIRASMNGRVVAVLVGIGDTVSTGQPVLVLDAMKMEHVHQAPVTGTVIALSVAEGEQVAAAQVLAEIEIPPSTLHQAGTQKADGG